MTVKRVEVLAYAKINLMLDIIRRRTDGYHDLFMIMQSVGVADRVTVEREPGRKLRLTASIEDIPLDDKNIAWKAAALFFKTTGLRRPGLHIHLEKHIPHAAGLAGGSADGAAVLVALNRLMGTGLSTDQLCAMGVQIGADVPFCIVGGTCLAQGIGEVLSPLKPMPSCHIVLAKPDFGVNTGKAYGLFDTNGKTHNADQLVCIGLGLTLGSLLVWGTFHLNNKYGEHGLMKLLAAKSHPRYILNRRKTNRMFKHKKKEE